MPTRSVYNHSLINQPLHAANNSNQMPPIAAPAAATAPPTTALAATSTHVDLTSYIGKVLTINQYQVVVEDILGQGGFAFVFLVRSQNQPQQRYALKRMYVNNEQDLQVCQREIAILKEFASNVNIVKYIDSSIQRLSPPVGQKRHVHLEKNVEDLDDDEDHEEDAIYEILLLTEYCSHGALTVSSVLFRERESRIPFPDPSEWTTDKWCFLERTSNPSHLCRYLHCCQHMSSASSSTDLTSWYQIREYSYWFSPIVCSLWFRFSNISSAVIYLRASTISIQSIDNSNHSATRRRNPAVHDSGLSPTGNDRSLQSNSDYVESRYLGDGLSSLQTDV